MYNEKNLRIYFEDEYCAIIYKRAGENSQTFFTALFPEKSFIAAVNRLDIPVSGLLLLAFSAQVQTLFSHAFKQNTIKKEYWAICERTTAASANTVSAQRLEHWLGFHTRSRKAFIGAPAGTAPAQGTGTDAVNDTKRRGTYAPIKRPKLNKAILYWSLCGKGLHYDFIRILPETGRTHQIRVQMAHIGRPIKGDLKYGARRSEPDGGIRLHSFALRFTHPITGKRINVNAAPMLPDTLWKDCIKACADSSAKHKADTDETD